MVAAQRVTARLRIRGGAPSLQAPRLGAIEAGATIYPVAQVVGDDVAGNATWFALEDNRFVWGGACVAATDAAATTGTDAGAIDVLRRDDGSIRNLPITEIKDVFGSFSFEEGRGGAIKIDAAWSGAHLTEVDCPLFAGTPLGKLTVHKKAADAFSRVFKAIEDAGHSDVVRTCAGTWVPRHMGWNPARALSSHSWGIAIDLNHQWNGYGCVPAPLGTIGSVREIVGMFEKEGFAWGGYFQPLPYTDGMHFEFARRDV